MESLEKLSRVGVPELDVILGVEKKVLDNGFVRVIDYLGSDHAIVQAARVSYGVGTKEIHEDRGLIRYLLRNQHTTPFEMCEIKLHVRVPMDTWRQWIRHRTANVNEYSTRYSVAIDAAHRTNPGDWRRQATGNRQGSKGNLPLDLGEELSNQEAELLQRCREVYSARLDADVAREQARKDLPLSTFTEAYWKIDLHNLFHFLALRMDGHAQKEIRVYADIIGHEIVARWCPLAWEAFLDYRLNALTISGPESEIIRAVVKGDTESAASLAEKQGMISRDQGVLRVKREGRELETKLASLALQIPWSVELRSTHD